jgi:hypothetical protein
MLLTKIEFASLLSYTPSPHDSETQKTKDFAIGLKSNEIMKQYNRSTSSFVAHTLTGYVESDFSDFFNPKPVLVPVPKSTLPIPKSILRGSEYLWVPSVLSKEIFSLGLGNRIVNCLDRKSPLPKSSTSKPEERPKPFQHYDSLSVQKLLDYDPPSILLVDDIITRGSTLLGAATRMAEVFPNSIIRAFAAIRTISNSFEFTKFIDPQVGTVELKGDNSFRTP